MKTKRIFLALALGAAMLVGFTQKADAQLVTFKTLTGTTDTTVSGSTTVLNYYATNLNPATSVTVQLSVKASAFTHDSIFGVGAVWGSCDNTSSNLSKVNWIQLSQLDTYNANFSDSLNVPNTTTGVSKVKTKFWTYNVRRSSQPIPRYFKIVWTNKGSSADTVDVKATLFIHNN